MDRQVNPQAVPRLQRGKTRRVARKSVRRVTPLETRATAAAVTELLERWDGRAEGLSMGRSPLQVMLAADVSTWTRCGERFVSPEVAVIVDTVSKIPVDFEIYVPHDPVMQ